MSDVWVCSWTARMFQTTANMISCFMSQDVAITAHTVQTNEKSPLVFRVSEAANLNPARSMCSCHNLSWTTRHTQDQVSGSSFTPPNETDGYTNRQPSEKVTRLSVHFYSALRARGLAGRCRTSFIFQKAACTRQHHCTPRTEGTTENIMRRWEEKKTKSKRHLALHDNACHPPPRNTLIRSLRPAVVQFTLMKACCLSFKQHHQQAACGCAATKFQDLT